MFGAWLMFALGSAQRSTLLVDDLSPALAATLGLLTAALYDPGAGVEWPGAAIQLSCERVAPPMNQCTSGAVSVDAGAAESSQDSILQGAAG